MISLSKKICLLGDYAVGKTSLARRFVYNAFDDRYLSTIGVKVSRKVIVLPYGANVIELTLMVWDLAGSEEFDTVRASYLHGSAGAIVVCDMTRPVTLETLPHYVADLHAASPTAQLVVVANKDDLTEKRQLTEQKISEASGALHAPYYLTSAKTGVNVETVFRHLGQLIIS